MASMVGDFGEESMIKKLTRIEFYRQVWDGREYRFKLNEGDVPSSILIDPTTIVAMSDKPVTDQVFKYNSSSWDKTGTPTEMYHVQTTIAKGRGINGVDFEGFWVTKDTYKKLLKDFIEIV